MSYVLHGDNRELLRALEPNSIDAIVTDPPYGLSFMGKGWDHGVPDVLYWTEALRVVKPGAHLVAFGGTRLYHRLTCAIEDAGWEIRDCLMWMYGSGFPKSLDVSKAIDKAAGAEREVVGRYQPPNGTEWNLKAAKDARTVDVFASSRNNLDITAPATDAAKQWDGWGTALKPAWEPIILARKPLTGTVATNVLAHGTGALNVDGCRVGNDGGSTQPSGMDRYNAKLAERGYRPSAYAQGAPAAPLPAGRWPANVVLDEDAAAALDAQSGTSRSTIGQPRKSRNPGDGYGMTHTGAEYDDFGGASRFFYCPKASRAEREYGLDQMRKGFLATMGNGIGEREHDENNSGAQARNTHPTVKPLALMQWLCRLIAPPNGLILDPFTGSGSTGCAALKEGFRFVGMEREAEYVAIAEARIAAHVNLFTEAA